MSETTLRLSPPGYLSYFSDRPQSGISGVKFLIPFFGKGTHPMPMSNCRRQEPRTDLNPPGIGILYSERSRYVPGTAMATEPDVEFVNVVNLTAAGVAISTPEAIETGTSINLGVYESDHSDWQFYAGKIKWTRRKDGGSDLHLAGARLQSTDGCLWPIDSGPSDQEKRPLVSNYQFLMSTGLFRSVPREAVCPLLNSLQYKFAKPGERIIRQGDEGDGLYLIQDGICTANVEKDGQVHTVARLKVGDIFGEMAILTGEPRSSHVDAETDMSLWYLNRESFNTIAHRFPEMREFLTALLAHWIEERPLTANRTVGRYIIQEVIGHGGFSIVYRGEHSGLNMPVAVKMLKHDMAMDRYFLRQFTGEARTIARLNHENIVRVFDIEKRYSTIFIIMEYLRGQPLKSVLQTMMHLPVIRTLNYLLQICAGLKYAHARGIVHQDIKPGNIFILPDGCVKIVDFGLACSTGTDHYMSGTPDYMAPEQVQCLPVDERTDIYALGLVAYEMLTGRRPFQADSPFDAMNLRVGAEIPDPGTFSKDLPAPLCSFIKKACARDPARRYQNLGEVMDALSPLAEAYDIYPGQCSIPKSKVAALYLFYEDSQQARLNELVHELIEKAGKLGVAVKTSPSKDD